MPATPYYLIDKSKLLRNMEKIAYVREHSGAKALLALKCFATWSVFDFMADYMDGTTSSSLYEVKLGREKFGVQVFLEPGEASITNSTTLEVTVLDTLFNGKNLAIVDSSIEAHMLDLLIYRENAKVLPNTGDHAYMICGKSCLAGDVFGEFNFEHEIKVGDRISVQDAAGYTMVKKNWFNGVGMPSIVIRELDGTERVMREFDFDDYVSSLS